MSLCVCVLCVRACVCEREGGREGVKREVEVEVEVKEARKASRSSVEKTQVLLVLFSSSPSHQVQLQVIERLALEQIVVVVLPQQSCLVAADDGLCCLGKEGKEH